MPAASEFSLASRSLVLAPPGLCDLWHGLPSSLHLPWTTFPLPTSRLLSSRSPWDSALLSPAYSRHGYKSSSYSHPCALTTPGRCEYHSHSPTSAWQRSAAGCDSSLPC